MRCYLLIILILMGLIPLSIIGCRSGQIRTVPIETRTTVVERLIEVATPADSSWLYAYLECDENNRVLLRGFEESKTAGMATQFSIDDLRLLNEVGNHQFKLSYRVVRVLDTIYIKARDSIIIKEVPYPVEVFVENNRLTGWQNFQVWAGRLFLALLALFLIFKIKIKL